MGIVSYITDTSFIVQFVVQLLVAFMVVIAFTVVDARHPDDPIAGRIIRIMIVIGCIPALFAWLLEEVAGYPGAALAGALCVPPAIVVAVLTTRCQPESSQHVAKCVAVIGVFGAVSVATVGILQYALLTNRMLGFASSNAESIASLSVGVAAAYATANLFIAAVYLLRQASIESQT